VLKKKIQPESSDIPPSKGDAMRTNRLLKLFGLVICTLILSGCIVKDSPAPGCIESIGLPAAGGCFGKTAIVDLKVAGPECITVEANNCNGGVLEIRNACRDTIQLDGIEIVPSGLVSLDMVETDGAIKLIETDSNFSKYIPDIDRQIEVKGAVGNQTIALAFTKTKLLCK
jgi:hypothetical protein